LFDTLVALRLRSRNCACTKCSPCRAAATSTPRLQLLTVHRHLTVSCRSEMRFAGSCRLACAPSAPRGRWPPGPCPAACFPVKGMCAAARRLAAVAQGARGQAGAVQRVRHALPAHVAAGPREPAGAQQPRPQALRRAGAPPAPACGAAQVFFLGTFLCGQPLLPMFYC